MAEDQGRVWYVMSANDTQLLLPLGFGGGGKTQYEEKDDFWSAYSFSVLSPHESLDCRAAKA